MTTRKKWTPKTEVTDALLKFREKRKWQLALRRYVIEQQLCPQYAPYFGLSIANYRQWIALQFTEGIGWDNFGKAWQLDHIVPVVYFDHANEEELKLCWNFVNVRVEKLEHNKARGNRVDVLAVKAYFERLYETTGYSACARMIDKINIIEVSAISSEPAIEDFIISNKEDLEIQSTFSHSEFNQLNEGMSVKDILVQRDIILKFGT